MKHFNLSEWALEHRAFTGFVMVLLLLGGIFAYFTLEQREDPKFTFRLMVVKTLYPGATALEVENQVTDRLEKKLQELPNLGLCPQLFKAWRIRHFRYATGRHSRYRNCLSLVSSTQKDCRHKTIHAARCDRSFFQR